MEIVPSASGIAPYKLAPLADAFYKILRPAEGARIDRMHNLSWEDPEQECRTCRTEKIFSTRLNGEIVEVECNCLEQWMLRRHLLHAGIGDAYQRYGWRHTEGVDREVLETVKLYTENLKEFADQGMGLILWSPRTGTGKTMLATLVLKEAMAQGFSGHFTSFTEMVDLHTSSWTSKEDRDWFTRRIMNVGFLVIDELGKENVFELDTVDRLLDQIIRSRVAHGRPTVITSNRQPSRSDNRSRQEVLAEEDEREVRDNQARLKMDSTPLAVGGKRARNAIALQRDWSRYQQGLIDLLGESSVVVEMPGADYRLRRFEQRKQDAFEGIRNPVVVR